MKDYKEYEPVGKTEQIILRVTPEEKREMFIEAQRLGISVSALLRLLYHKREI